MKVEARRDDGAVMVTDGLGAAVVLPSGRVSYLPKDSAYARGGWEPSTGAVPAEVDPQLLAQARERAMAATLQ